MKKLIQFALLCLVATLGHADPLANTYLPSVNTSCPNTTANGSLSNVWITNTMTKVQQQAGAPTSACYLIVYGTQNEFLDFQVHVQAPSGGYSALTVTASDFVQTAPASSTISASSTNIQVYREAYMNVTGYVTATADTFYGAQGYYPDALIPTVDPYTSQTTNAWPVSVAATQNQSAWIDILVPPSAPSGYYLGSITVKNSGTTIATIPVIIAVWQWPSAGYMPSTATLGSVLSTAYIDACYQFYGGYTGCSAYPGAGGSSDLGQTLLQTDMIRLFLDHRMTVSGNISTYTTNFTGLQNYFGPYLGGTGGTLLSGAKMTSADYPNGNPPAYASNWATEFASQGWTSLFNQTTDEPETNCTAWSNTFPWATTYHGTTPPTPVLITGTIAQATTCSALNYVDWLTPTIFDLDPYGGTLQRSTYNTWLAGSAGPTRRIGTYIGCGAVGGSISGCANGSPGGSQATWPNLDVDGKPAANRADEWLSFWHQIGYTLNYDTTCAWDASNGCYSGLPGTPWVSNYAFGEWGDGTYVYPSTSYNGTSFTNYVTASGGGALATPIIVPSIRLKNMRDGMQDYEYLNVLNNHGQGSLVTTEINSWITNSYTFETTGSGLEAARTALGTAMHQLTYGDFTLSITLTGNGAALGSLTGTNCSSASYTPGATITCVPSYSSGAVFTGWGGACSGMGTCSFDISSNTTLTANYVLTIAQALGIDTATAATAPNLPAALGWNINTIPGDTCGSGPDCTAPASATQSIGNSSPAGAPSGVSMLTSQTTEPTSEYTNSSWWYWLDGNDSATNFIEDHWFYVTNIAQANAIEMDAAQYNLTEFREHMFGHQCVSGGYWQVGNLETWTNTTVPCSLPAGWHRAIWTSHRVPGDVACGGYECNYYDELTLDGTSYSINMTLPSDALAIDYPSALIDQFQIDNLPTSGTPSTISVNLDDVNFSAYAPASASLPTGAYGQVGFYGSVTLP